MKKVLFCIVCLNIILSCFGQPAKVKLVAEDHKIVLFGNERYELEKGETRWVTLEGDPMYSEYLRAGENCFLFLEAGDSLAITLKESGNIEFNDEGNLCVPPESMAAKSGILEGEVAACPDSTAVSRRRVPGIRLGKNV